LPDFLTFVVAKKVLEEIDVAAAATLATFAGTTYQERVVAYLAVHRDGAATALPRPSSESHSQTRQGLAASGLTAVNSVHGDLDSCSH